MALTASQQKLLDILTKSERNSASPMLNKHNLFNICESLLQNEVSENASYGQFFNKEQLIEKHTSIMQDIFKTFKSDDRYKKITVPTENFYTRDDLFKGMVQFNSDLYSTPEGIKRAHKKNAIFILKGLDGINKRNADDSYNNLSFSDIADNAKSAYDSIYSVPTMGGASLDNLKESDPEAYKEATLGKKENEPDDIQQSINTLDQMQKKINSAGFFKIVGNLFSYFRAKSAMNKFKDNLVKRGFDKDSLDNLCKGQGNAKTIINNASDEYFEKNNKLYHDNLKKKELSMARLNYQKDNTLRLQKELELKRPLLLNDVENFREYRNLIDYDNLIKKGTDEKAMKEAAEKGDAKYIKFFELKDRSHTAKQEVLSLQASIKDSSDIENLQKTRINEADSFNKNYLEKFNRFYPNANGQIPISHNDRILNDYNVAKERARLAEKNLNEQKYSNQKLNEFANNFNNRTIKDVEELKNNFINNLELNTLEKYNNMVIGNVVKMTNSKNILDYTGSEKSIKPFEEMVSTTSKQLSTYENLCKQNKITIPQQFSNKEEFKNKIIGDTTNSAPTQVSQKSTEINSPVTNIEKGQ